MLKIIFCLFSYISIKKVYYRWELLASSIFSMVVVVDLNVLLQNFRNAEEDIKSMIFKATFLIAGIALGVIIVAAV